jgi:hypothetical protein
MRKVIATVVLAAATALAVAGVAGANPGHGHALGQNAPGMSDGR